MPRARASGCAIWRVRAATARTGTASRPQSGRALRVPERPAHAPEEAIRGINHLVARIPHSRRYPLPVCYGREYACAEFVLDSMTKVFAERSRGVERRRRRPWAQRRVHGLVGPRAAGSRQSSGSSPGLEEITADGSSSATATSPTWRRGPRRRDGVPDYALYPHMTSREPRLRAEDARDAGGRDPRRVTEVAGCSGSRTARAPARGLSGGSGSGSRSAARSSASRPRSSWTSRSRPRREAARRDARRTLAAARPARRDHGVRHPRPGRGDDARATASP